MKSASDAPWFQLPRPRIDSATRVLVIGGGIAGVCAAHALARRGLEVTLLERERELAGAASGNPSAVILPALSVKPDPFSECFKFAYRWVLHLLAELEKKGLNPDWHATGVIHLAAKDKVKRLHAALLEEGRNSDLARPMDAAAASKACGVPTDLPALHYPEGGYLDPKAFCRNLAALVPFTIRTDCPVAALVRDGDAWQVHAADGATLGRAPIVVLANGYEALACSQAADLPLTKARGQLATVPAALATPLPRTVICYDGYLVPEHRGALVIGATYNPFDDSPDLHPRDHALLLQKARRWLPNLHFSQTPPLAGRAAFRTRSPDHLPLAGPLPDAARFREVYGELHLGRRQQTYPPGPYHAGLYASLGHGGRGMVSAPLCGELLAAQICGDPLPLPPQLVAALNPARYLIRQLRKDPNHRP